MTWFKQKFRNWLFNEDDRPEAVYQTKLSMASDCHSIDSDKGIRLAAYKANGGMVVETNFYDRIKDRSHRTLHIITEEQDLGYEIGKIITMETLKI
jgi:hypothetical protein